MAARKARYTEHRARRRRFRRLIGSGQPSHGPAVGGMAGGAAPQGGGCCPGSSIQSLPRSTNPEPGNGDLRDMCRDPALGRAPRRMAEHKVAYGQELKCATLNVNSIIKPMPHRHIERHMEDRGVSLLCLQETKVSHTTQYGVGDLLLHHAR